MYLAGAFNCYAERIAARFSGKGEPYDGLARLVKITETDPKARNLTRSEARWTGDVRFIEKHLLDPIRWQRPRKIFVNSMSDLFHEHVDEEWIDKIFAVMALAPQHTYQILTKRPERMLDYFKNCYGVRDEESLIRGAMIEGMAQKLYYEHIEKDDSVSEWLAVHLPLKHVQLGVSVEDQKTADARIALLLQTPAAVRWISYEPALNSVDLTDHLTAIWHDKTAYMPGERVPENKPRLDWVVMGGESGPRARPMSIDWVRSVRDQCRNALVPFYFKQWGDWRPALTPAEQAVVAQLRARRRLRNVCRIAGTSPVDYFRMGKKRAGHLIDGREWRYFPGKTESEIKSDIETNA